MTDTVEIQGLRELVSRLDSKKTIDAAKSALKAGALHLKGKIAIYPESTIANSPSNPTGRWYERGFGPRWTRKTMSGLGGRKTSETLGRKWTTRSENFGMTQVVGNNVSYGGYVQREATDEPNQTWFHAAHGWKTDRKVAEEETEKIVKFVRDAIAKSLAG